ncbi:MAG: DUF58 domain-containing protein [Treponema sp.]|jgi:uncharacterized protein (DUF58 family)|nr:DUF58 domain-containing protein [Treponema sp.]
MQKTSVRKIHATRGRRGERSVSSEPEALIGGRGVLIAGVAVLAPAFLCAPLFVAQFLCLFLLLIIITSRMYTEYLVRHITLIRRDGELREFKRQWVSVELIVENRGVIPAYALAIYDSPGMLAPVQGVKFACALPHRSRIVQVWKGFCSERGVFFLGPATIRGSDPCGLFPFQITYTDMTTLFVYPQPRISGITPSGGVPLGALLSHNPLNEDLSRACSLRPYQAGDEPRRINWKASAKTGGGAAFSLMVHEYEATVSYPCMVFLNLDLRLYPPRKSHAYSERAIEAAAALCRESSERKQNTGIIIFSGGKPEKIDSIAQSRFALIPILERLALFQQGNRQDTPLTADEKNRCVTVLLERAKHMQAGTRIMYVGPDLEHDAYLSLSILIKFHLSIEYLIIDEKSVSALAPGNMKRYQMKDMGYAII